MYKKPESTPELPDFALPFEGCLNPENRWIKLARRLPWHELEADYAKCFKSCGRGEIALNVRIALGALLIKEMLGLSVSVRRIHHKGVESGKEAGFEITDWLAVASCEEAVRGVWRGDGN